ncbi:hypothetical protein B0H16DRAFT_1310984 [Mycena metata]|uniref:MULE transposase domain-containing protein n=1 Tax=Mycena metata TaxID=1033252 RepID=A0AAD7JJG8_9AGAR|nr:hypothetical protein B0H16DRAFT_1310984 [Mycena metata]
MASTTRDVDPVPQSIQSIKNTILQVPPLTKKAVDPNSLLAKLRFSDADKKAASEHIDSVGLDSVKFTTGEDDQTRAFEHLTDLGLHLPGEIDRDARSKISIVTSAKSPSKSKCKTMTFSRHRTLFQCQCGADNKEGRHASKKREMGWENVGCGAWYRLTSTHDERDPKNPIVLTIDEIIGQFTHSITCQQTQTMSRNPRIPLHPDLRAHALVLLRQKLPLPQLKQQCREWARKKWGLDAGDASYRYVLTDHETTSLYRTLAREAGIPQRSAPQDNIDLWFRKDGAKPPDPRLPASCVSYIPCMPGVSERFSIILQTPEPRQLAWKFGHKKQMLMDLTFGVCNGRALLAILMVIDDQNKGLPVALMLFTAKKETKAVHADYDKKLLAEQLTLFKTGMGTNEAGEAFDPYVGGTDNDPRERHGLRFTWITILLLLCIFHVWQAWRNGLTKHLRIIPKGADRQLIRNHLGKFLMRLLKEINVYEDAITAYNAEIAHFKLLGRERSRLAKEQSKGALRFLTYLQTYLKSRDMWPSWSLSGAEEAAERMGIPISRVARTTNHLESFNGRLKGKYVAQHMHSGRLPRIDFWILTIVTKVLPEFFEAWAEKRECTEYYTSMRGAPPAVKTALIPRSRLNLATHDQHPPPPPNTPFPTTPRTSLTDPVAPESTPEQLTAAAKAWINAVLENTQDDTGTPLQDVQWSTEFEEQLQKEIEEEEDFSCVALSSITSSSSSLAHLSLPLSCRD